MNTESHVSKRVNTLRQKWPKIELQSLRNKIYSVNMKNLFSIRHNKEKSVNRLILNSTKSSTSSGTRISSKPRRKMLKPSANLRIDTLKKSSRIDNSWRRSCLLLSSFRLSFLIIRRSKPRSPKEESK